MRRRFFVEKFVDGAAVVRGETAEHLGRVLRAEPGQLYELSDGASVWLARIESVERPKRGDSRIEFMLLEPIEAREPRVALRLLISIIKFERFEWCLEKATELGASEIVPLAAARSDKPLIDAANKRRARWEKIVVESAQQARRLRAPKLGEIIRREDVFRAATTDCKILLSERADAPAMREIVRPGIEIQSAALAIGPEGGWSDEEIAAAGASGFQEASLGENILRTETAVIAAMSVMRFAIG
ncbi:MAG: RsmE family RNA methyltransferase [Candidatus Acidiferrales bacterium]